jgi:hypothetical protein
MIRLAALLAGAVVICTPASAQQANAAAPRAGMPAAAPSGDHEAERLRTAHRMNRQGIETARRGDWIGALRMFEMAARYAPRDAVIQRNLDEARIRAARQTEELKRQRQPQRR